MRRFGQASLEFLTTYGWMLLVAGAVAGAMMYMGVFSPEKNLPQQCDLTLDFSCDKFVIVADGTVRVQSTNKIGEPVDVVSFSCVYPDGTVETNGYTGSSQWDPGEAFDLACAPPGGTVNFAPDTREQVKLKLEYKKVTGGFTKIAEGKIAANVVES